MTAIHWQWLKKGVTLFFFILVPVLLFMLIRNVDWGEVKVALQGYSAPVLLAGAGLAALSYFVFSSYELLGRAYTGHGIPLKQVYPLAFVCYSFNLNFGAWVGGIALRYRLYSRLGLQAGIITRILSLSLLTNWLGYMLLAGTVFSLGMMDLPEGWAIGEPMLRLIGIALLAVTAIYILACHFSTKRSFNLRGHEIELPTLRMALLQITLGAVNWSLMAAIIFLLLPEEAAYPAVLGVLLISSIAGVITHIPAGLGVLETVFIALFQHLIPSGVLVAALIGYRAIYFLLPLGFAVITYLILERSAKSIAPDDHATGLRINVASGGRSSSND